MYKKLFLIITLVLVSLSFAEQSEPFVLFDFSGSFDVDSVLTSDAEVTHTRSGALHVETGHENKWPGITLKAPKGKWDLSRFEYVSLDVKNVSDESVTVYCRVDNPGADGRKNCVTGNIKLSGRQKETLTVRLLPTPWRLTEPLELIGMRGNPTYSDKLDPSNVTQLLVFVSSPKSDHVFEIENIRAGGRVEVLDAKTFLPFIDEFGQFIHRDWPGKTHSLEELKAHGKSENMDIAANPGPDDRNQYGGWTAGPKLKATDFFRAEKYKGKWWLVDPEGRLFWSHGIDCVHANTATPITDRENYFTWLPEKDSPFAEFYGWGSWGPHGYYKGKTYRSYDMFRANLIRKYGKNYSGIFNHNTHRRLKSWGLNTIANWSDSKIFLMRRTAYTDNASFDSPRIEGSTGYWGKFYDVFDPAFSSNLIKRLERAKTTSANDPWCIGYFVHNEIAWGDELSLALAALASPADQPAKKVFLSDLKAKYKTIDKLNAAWQSEYKSWDDLLKRTDRPDRKKAYDDLAGFYDKIADTYFKTIHDELEKVAPNQLYFGCRFAWVNDRAARAAAKYCDVVCYNKYSYSVADHRLPDNIDKPIIVGEFHFGALDRGMFHTGLRKTVNQQDRAEKYRSYVRGALRNPYIVGTHWFQYKDQATTGRGDGENYQIGFVDICDKPYPEIIKAGRDVGYNLYEYRLDTVY